MSERRSSSSLPQLDIERWRSEQPLPVAQAGRWGLASSWLYDPLYQSQESFSRYVGGVEGGSAYGSGDVDSWTIPSDQDLQISEDIRAAREANSNFNNINHNNYGDNVEAGSINGNGGMIPTSELQPSFCLNNPEALDAHTSHSVATNVQSSDDYNSIFQVLGRSDMNNVIHLQPEHNRGLDTISQSRVDQVPRPRLPTLRTFSSAGPHNPLLSPLSVAPSPLSLVGGGSRFSSTPATSFNGSPALNDAGCPINSSVLLAHPHQVAASQADVQSNSSIGGVTDAVRSDADKSAHLPVEPQSGMDAAFGSPEFSQEHIAARTPSIDSPSLETERGGSPSGDVAPILSTSPVPQGTIQSTTSAAPVAATVNQAAVISEFGIYQVLSPNERRAIPIDDMQEEMFPFCVANPMFKPQNNWILYRRYFNGTRTQEDARKELSSCGGAVVGAAQAVMSKAASKGYHALSPEDNAKWIRFAKRVNDAVQAKRAALTPAERDAAVAAARSSKQQKGKGKKAKKASKGKGASGKVQAGHEVTPGDAQKMRRATPYDKKSSKRTTTTYMGSQQNSMWADGPMGTRVPQFAGPAFSLSNAPAFSVSQYGVPGPSYSSSNASTFQASQYQASGSAGPSYSSPNVPSFPGWQSQTLGPLGFDESSSYPLPFLGTQEQTPSGVGSSLSHFPTFPEIQRQPAGPVYPNFSSLTFPGAQDPLSFGTVHPEMPSFYDATIPLEEQYESLTSAGLGYTHASMPSMPIDNNNEGMYPLQFPVAQPSTTVPTSASSSSAGQTAQTSAPMDYPSITWHAPYTFPPN